MAIKNKADNNSVLSRLQYLDKQLSNPNLTQKEIKILKMREENLLEMLNNDQTDFNKGGMATKAKKKSKSVSKKYVNPVKIVDNRKKKK